MIRKDIKRINLQRLVIFTTKEERTIEYAWIMNFQTKRKVDQERKRG